MNDMAKEFLAAAAGAAGSIAGAKVSGTAVGMVAGAVAKVAPRTPGLGLAVTVASLAGATVGGQFAYRYARSKLGI